MGLQGALEQTVEFSNCSVIDVPCTKVRADDADERPGCENDHGGGECEIAVEEDAADDHEDAGGDGRCARPKR